MAKLSSYFLCRRSRQRQDDLLDGRRDPEALFLRLHVRFCPHCRPWFRLEQDLQREMRAKLNSAGGGRQAVLEALRRRDP